MAVDLSVVIPVYRNAPTLAALAGQVIDVAHSLGVTHEIVFVHDASPDESLERLIEIAAAHPSVSIIDMARNVGQHAAVLHGLARANGQVCVVMDADLQDRPASLTVLWHARSPDASAVFGGRRGSYEQRGRHVTSWAFKWFLHVLTGVPRDAGIFVLLERDLVDALVRFPTHTPWIQAMIGCLGARTLSVPVDRDMRAQGASSYSWSGRVRTAARGVLCVLEYRVWRAPRPYLEQASQAGIARLAVSAITRMD